MAYAIFPLTLPRWVSRDGFQRGMRDGRLFTDMEGGPPKVRRRFTSAVMPAQFRTIMSTSELALWDEFWEVTLGQGTQPFWKPDPIYNDLAVITDPGAILTDVDGNPIGTVIWWLCRFAKEAPVIVADGIEWSVSFSVDILP